MISNIQDGSKLRGDLIFVLRTQVLGGNYKWRPKPAYDPWSVDTVVASYLMAATCRPACFTWKAGKDHINLEGQ